MSLTAIKLTAAGMHVAMARVSTTPRTAAEFAHACLTSAYNGEDWYFVYETSGSILDLDFTRAIMTAAVFESKYEPLFANDECRTKFQVKHK